MITISNSIFDAKGENKKDKVYGITLNGSESVTIENCEFKNTGYSSILNHCMGDVTIKGCKFHCGNVYNPIEGGQTIANGNVVVENCEFLDAPGNNYINFYRVMHGSVHNIVDCKFNPTVDNNIIRLSNTNNADATFHISNCEYTFAEGTPSDYTGMIICQDYTNQNGNKQDFSKYTVVLKNVLCDGEILESDKAPVKGCLYYVYEDGANLITGTNDPVIKFT